MKIACFVPIKSYSERIPGKNLKLLNEKPLYHYLCEHIKEADVFDDVYVDTNNKDVADFAVSLGFKVIQRKEELASNTANGNDLLNYHFETFPFYDYYFQLFVTAPFLRPETIKECVNIFYDNTKYDSCFTATRNFGFYWMNNIPVNYRPGILPRSQNLTPLIEETTGLYGISREALRKYKCRIGICPYIKIIDKFEAVDINTEDDFKLAEIVQTMLLGERERERDLTKFIPPVVLLKGGEAA